MLNVSLLTLSTYSNLFRLDAIKGYYYYVMLCYVMLSHTMLCYVMLCYVMLGCPLLPLLLSLLPPLSLSLPNILLRQFLFTFRSLPPSPSYFSPIKSDFAVWSC